jgi:hypothetical protein
MHRRAELASSRIPSPMLCWGCSGDGERVESRRFGNGSCSDDRRRARAPNPGRTGANPND